MVFRLVFRGISLVSFIKSNIVEGGFFDKEAEEFADYAAS
jgi:hypothetical protein